MAFMPKNNTPLTGESLFHMYVSMGLCISIVYQWRELSPSMQGRWERLAEQLVEQLKGKS